MNWNSTLEKAINYIEENLREDFTLEDVAKASASSSLYLQKGFAIATGISMGEYIRNRRLYCAASEILSSENPKILDIAIKYGYETAESFSKAFYRFHGTNPSSLKKNPGMLKTFLPIKININMDGGYKSLSPEFETFKYSGFKIVGFKKTMSWENYLNEIPEFYMEFNKKFEFIFNKKFSELNEIEKAVLNFRISEFGLTIDNNKDGTFDYVIGGLYTGQDIPEGMEVFDIPPSSWIRFSKKGSLPQSIQTLIDSIFRKWVPSHPEYKPAFDILVEKYSLMNFFANPEDCISEAWIPYSLSE